MHPIEQELYTLLCFTPTALGNLFILFKSEFPETATVNVNFFMATKASKSCFALQSDTQLV